METLLPIPQNSSVSEDLLYTSLRNPDTFTKMASEADSASVIEAICHLSLLAQGLISTLTLYNIWDAGTLERTYRNNEGVTNFVIVRLHTMIEQVDSGEIRNKKLDPWDPDVQSTKGPCTGFGFDNITSGGATKGKYHDRFQDSEAVTKFFKKQRFKAKLWSHIENTLRNLKQKHADKCKIFKIGISHLVDTYRDPFNDILPTCLYLNHTDWMALLNFNRAHSLLDRTSGVSRFKI